MRLFFDIGVRYFFRRRQKRGVSLISFVSLAGIALGVLALTLVISVMNGFDRELKKRILGVVPHLVMEMSLDEWQTIEASVDSDIRPVAAGEFLDLHAMLVNEYGNQLVTVYGINPLEDPELSVLTDHMVFGDLQSLSEKDLGLLIGEPLAIKLGLGPGDGVRLVIPATSESGNLIKPVIHTVQITGIFRLGSELDYGLVVMHIGGLSKITGQAKKLRVKMADVFNAKKLAAVLALESGDEVRTWADQYGDFFETVKMEKTMMFILMSVIIAIAAFNIVSSLSIMVKDKQSDIAILRTMGASQFGILMIFILQGAMVGIIGLLLGLASGVPLALNITGIVGFFEDIFGGRVLAGTYFDSVPSYVRLTDLVVISGFSILITLMATLGPAIRATRLKPAEVLRAE